MSFPLALCWGTLPGTPLVELAEIAAAAGYAHITITAGLYSQALAAGETDATLRRRLKHAGIGVAVVDPLIGMLPGVPPAETVPEAYRPFLRFTAYECFAAAAALDAPTVNLAHFLGQAVPLAELAETVAQLAARGRREGRVLSIEFIPDTGIPDLATALTLAHLAGGGIGVMFDTWHFVRSNGVIEDLDGLGPHAIGGVQLSDRTPPAPGEAYVPMSGRKLPGEGEIPLVEILRRVLPAAAGVPIGVEVFSAELAALPKVDAARRVAEATRRVLARL